MFKSWILISCLLLHLVCLSEQSSHEHEGHDDHVMPFTMDMSTMEPGMGHEDGSMKMFFHAGVHETLLFKQWMLMSWQEMLGACVGLIIVGIISEGLKIAHQAVYSRLQPAQSKTQKLRESYQMGYNAYGAFDTVETGSQVSDATLVDMGEDHWDSGCEPIHPMCSGWNWLQVLIYMIQVFLGYCLMLAVMTFNVYLCIAVILGAGIGHLIFGWMQTNINHATERLHC